MAMSGTETKARQDRIFGVPEQVSTGAVGGLQVVQFGCRWHLAFAREGFQFRPRTAIQLPTLGNVAVS